MESTKNKDIYLKKGADIIRLHATGDFTDMGFHQYSAQADLYSPQFKFLGVLYKIHVSIEQEAQELKDFGWLEICGPKERK